MLRSQQKGISEMQEMGNCREKKKKSGEKRQEQDAEKQKQSPERQKGKLRFLPLLFYKNK